MVEYIVLGFFIGVVFSISVFMWFIRHMKKDGYLIMDITKKFRKEIMGEKE